MAQVSGLAVDELLKEAGGENEFQELVNKKLQIFEKAIVAKGEEHKQQAKERKKKQDEQLKRPKINKEKKNDLDRDIGNNDQNQNTPGADMDARNKIEPDIPKLAEWLIRVAQASGVDKSEALKQAIVMIMEEKSTVISPKVALHYLQTIEELAQLAGTTPEILLGQKQWRELIGSWCRELSQQCEHWLKKFPAKPDENPFAREAWQALHFLLKQNNLSPSSSEVNIPVATWEKLKKLLGDPVPVEERKQSRQEKKEDHHAEKVIAAHRSFLLRTLDLMRQNALSLDTAVVTAEVAAVTVSFFAASPIFAAVSSLAVTVKLAQLTGAAINKLRGKS